MHSASIAFDNYPEWYRIEKETEKTVKKLTTLKELSPYLINSDEFIRRLAILRINELRLKDAIISLKELLDDPLETTNNKELAAWTIKVISLHWNTDLFITNKYLNKYSGKERYTDVCKVSIKDTLPSLKFDFTSSMFNSELQLESNDIRSSKDIDFDLPFSVKEWFSQYSQDILADLKVLMIKLPIILFRGLKTAVVLTFAGIFTGFKCVIIIASKIRIRRSRGAGNGNAPAAVSKEAAAVNSKNYYKSGYYQESDLHSLRSSYNREFYHDGSIREKFSLVKYIKKLVFYMFYILFTPVRTVIKHKKLLIPILIALYCFLTFTTTGKMFTYKYTGLELIEVQTKVYNSAREILTYAWDEAQEFMGISGSSHPDKAVEYENRENASIEASKSKYKVIAKTGLNLRQEPDASSSKILKLDYNLIVMYTGEFKETSTGTWFKVKTSDGTTGWAASKYLEEIGGF